VSNVDSGTALRTRVTMPSPIKEPKALTPGPGRTSPARVFAPQPKARRKVAKPR